MLGRSSIMRPGRDAICATDRGACIEVTLTEFCAESIVGGM
jgi:hypothetical protein